MLSEIGLIDKLQKIQALYLGAMTPGERAAAAQAMTNIQNKLENYKQQDRVTEWKFGVNNYFEKRLLKAILNKYGIDSYRYHGQRHTTLNAKASDSMINKVIWPQYQEMSKVLRDHFDKLTNEVIKEALGEEEREDEIRQESPQLSYH
jgi:hypothetical protein